MVSAHIDIADYEDVQYKEGSTIRGADVLDFETKTCMKSSQVVFGCVHTSLNSVLVQPGSNMSAGIVLGTLGLGLGLGLGLV